MDTFHLKKESVFHAKNEETVPCGIQGTDGCVDAAHPNKRLIHVIWDNAAYHKGPDVREFLAQPDCRIHLIQLPPYCPHLNPIERLWAVMHQCVTHNHHCATQKQFANAILRFFRETLSREWKTFQSQVSDNFRVVTHQKFRVLG